MKILIVVSGTVAAIVGFRVFAQESLTRPEPLTVVEQASLGSVMSKNDDFVLFDPKGTRMVEFIPETTKGSGLVDALTRVGSSSIPGHMLVDGREGEKFGFIRSTVFSPDGRRFGYVGQKRVEKHGLSGRRVSGEAEKWIIVDDQKFGPYDDVTGLEFSPDGNHWTSGVRLGKEAFVLLDGKEDSRRFSELASVKFSPDGSQLVFAARRDGGWFAVRGAEEAQAYERLGEVFLSADGRHMGHRALSHKRLFMVVDGVAHQAHDRLSQPVFSADGAHLAYWAEDGKKAVLIVDGEVRAQSERAQSWEQPFVFSRIGSQLAYALRRNKRSVVVVDGKEVGDHDGETFGLQLSNDGRRFGYGLATNESWWLKDHYLYVVVDGKETPTHIHVGSLFTFTDFKVKLSPQFSPGGEHVAWVESARPDCKQWNFECGVRVVADNDVSGAYESIRALFWIDDSTVRVVERTENEYFRVDLRPSKPSSR